MCLIFQLMENLASKNILRLGTILLMSVDFPGFLLVSFEPPKLGSFMMTFILADS